MNKKIIELIKPNSYTYTRQYNCFVQDEWGTWVTTGAAGNSLVKDSVIQSYCSGYTASATLPKINSTRTIKGLRKAKSISINFRVNYQTIKGWYVREQPDGYLQMLNGYIMMRCGGRGSYISVGGQTLLNTTKDARYNTTFYQKYMVCNGTRYDYPNDVRLKNATGDSLLAYAYGGFITSNDYFECYTSLFLDTFIVVHTT